MFQFLKALELKNIDLEKAQFLCSLPKSLGINPENQKRNYIEHRKIWSLFKM